MYVLSHQEAETVNILQRDSGTLSHTVKGILGHMERNIDLILQTTIKTSKQGSASREIDTVLYDIGIQLWRCILEC